MIYAQSVELSFDAGHTVPGERRCETPHGHHWVCVVTVKSDGMPAKQTDLNKLRDELDQIGRELSNRDLNKMLPGTIPNTLGVANYLWDRLAIGLPLVEVRVTADGSSSVIRP